MGRSKALILAAAVAVGANAGAHAADLLPPPPPIIEAPPPPEPGGWYLRGDVGVGALQATDWRSSLEPNSFGLLPNGPVWPVFASLGDTAFAGAGFGYQLNNWFRADVTGEYRIMSNYRAGMAYVDMTRPAGWIGPFPGTFGADAYSAQLGSAVFMANGYVDLGTWYGVTPFVGAGVGLAAHNLNGLVDTAVGVPGIGFASDKHQTNFAWAVMGGLGFNVTPNLKLEVGYRYLDMGRITSNPILCSAAAACFRERHAFNVASHDVRVGFRYLLGGVAPIPVLAPPPGPLVRKY